ncbi:hypothetical protein GCM10011403_20360 [Pseudohongiella nitratireducens]|uniref:Uncharacterized protein n=1 Tax=Pseudohongiella nitratireducens TaxID=1768907 RepID=A0A916QLW3_9GAMM|nr:hypothetical protein GCM10011403_20360 [Pseudohongiella nitratireducens]
MISIGETVWLKLNSLESLDDSAPIAITATTEIINTNENPHLKVETLSRDI